MDLQTRKIVFIKEFFKLQNEEIISSFEKLMKKAKKKHTIENIKPFTMEEFYKRIDISIEDSKNERIIELNELLSEIEEWN